MARTAAERPAAAAAERAAQQGAPPTPVAVERPRAAPTPLVGAAAARPSAERDGGSAARGAQGTSLHRGAPAEREEARAVPAPVSVPRHLAEVRVRVRVRVS